LDDTITEIVNTSISNHKGDKSVHKLYQGGDKSVQFKSQGITQTRDKYTLKCSKFIKVNLFSKVLSGL